MQQTPQRRIGGLAAAALMAAVAGMSMSGSAEVFHRSIRVPDFPKPLRASGYRQGRRFRSPTRKGGNPAGTKLARKAAQGTLTICGIR